MPVITRSQSKKNEMKDNFVLSLNKLMLLCSTAKGKENKMRVCLEVFQIVNNNLPELVKKNKGDVWIRLAATMFNKTTEMNEDERQGGWVYVDKTLSKKFKTELLKCREFTGSYVKANSVLSPKQDICVFRAVEEIQKMEKSSRPRRNIARVEEAAKLEYSRPRRNIARVDYRGMDTMEPEF
jgi:hypothetical protein